MTTFDAKSPTRIYTPEHASKLAACLDNLLQIAMLVKECNSTRLSISQRNKLESQKLQVLPIMI
jgi:hypothetical protein